jgi:carbonic anhydrase
MSCQQGTSPIDISMKKVVGKCDLKCSYNFKYFPSNCVAKNQDDYIALSYDNTSNPPVTYNSQSYVVDKIRLYFPSVHSFNGQKADGELIIIHTPVLGGRQLLVCVPIKATGVNSPQSMILSKIVVETASKAPAEGESTQVFTDFDLNKMVPKKPYFSYSGTLPFQPCDGLVDYIVYNVFENALDMSPAVLSKAQSFIKPNAYVSKENGKLFFNKNGPNRDADNQIYIKCNPTGSSGKTDVVTSTSTESSSFDFNSFLSSTNGYILICVLLFVVIIYAFNYLLGILKGNDISIPFANTSSKS